MHAIPWRRGGRPDTVRTQSRRRTGAQHELSVRTASALAAGERACRLPHRTEEENVAGPTGEIKDKARDYGRDQKSAHWSISLLVCVVSKRSNETQDQRPRELEVTS